MSIDLERFLALEGQILEPVPEVERGNYQYWRAAHLGNIALNFLEGRLNLNARQMGFAHFWDKYEYAVNTARDLTLAKRPRLTQFDEGHAIQLSRLGGVPLSFNHPSMVLALDPSVKDVRVEKHPGEDPFSDDMFSLAALRRPFSPGGGYVVWGRLRLQDIDPYSRQALYELFGDVDAS